MKAKLENGWLVPLQLPIYVGSVAITEPTDKQLLELGYKDFISIDEPVSEPTKRCNVYYDETDTTITQRWEFEYLSEDEIMALRKIAYQSPECMSLKDELTAAEFELKMSETPKEIEKYTERVAKLTEELKELRNKIKQTYKIGDVVI